MNNDASRPLRSTFTQSPTARIGVSGGRIHDSALARVAQALHEHGLPATLRPTGSLKLSVATSRFTAHTLPGPGTAIEVRVFREGRHSILGLVSHPDEAAHLLIRSAGMAAAWQLASEVHDRLVLDGDTTVLAEVPMGDTVFVRLGERAYAELVADDADACLGQAAGITLTTHIARQPLGSAWRFDHLLDRDFPTMGRIAGGTFSSAESACAAVALHRARTAEWESLH
ncbi:putative protein OS=Tsukamurella paurometabola (strain ATCC 8368 / DSM / CCUG 35730 /CIP 100753 / JCM 10117 / KCTC 9821 / NBRC 16120 / NCIMB 702349/ NCTC 13040) OX=521096 GN=Tpau_1996 PE=4 SV=1 [Tsukamurella paurometabola]|uniref:Uncharacterized protein n=1 Tax=Tsukamurella paurometabola (strain ATCC 8368 / DSM 20162 / CCUG 35730 / CIP 100753 / JCM 10117 / KCTC 9821 / NBRC 16120 / NCIMB 702349 / NCTC 13040) TaxID=521096 RepID=D5UNP0_TSUPD|nr:hypothetical protein [Tsukamurella paurometabola]ADG78608.1 hypothetical protein Tpau_1996 [Tsukamurella paurometabola DSM 20162]SUP32403.1 Uncharacterised protein [Tsukamurella paurometabola]